MKTLIGILFVLSVGVLMSAPLIPGVGRLKVVNPSVIVTFSEDFEGTGYENTWTEVGNPDEDYTGDPLEGSQSWRTSTTGQSQYAFPNTFEASNYTTTCFMLKYTTTQIYRDIFRGCRSDTIAAWKLMWGGTAGKLVVQHGGSQSGSSTITLSPGVLYYVWVEYEISTATNGKLRLYVSTDTTKPSADATAVRTAGTSTYEHSRFIIPATDSGTVDFILDHIRVLNSATEVTYWPD